MLVRCQPLRPVCCVRCAEQEAEFGLGLPDKTHLGSSPITLLYRQGTLPKKSRQGATQPQARFLRASLPTKSPCALCTLHQIKS